MIHNFLRIWVPNTNYFFSYVFTVLGSNNFLPIAFRYMAEGNVGWQLQTLKYDLMREYRNTIPEEEQDQIWKEVRIFLERFLCSDRRNYWTDMTRVSKGRFYKLFG